MEQNYFNIPSKSEKTICLNMIVKDESHIIKKTLNNICDNIKLDYWVICDTGSTDNTIQIIKNFFEEKKIQGEIHQDKWKDFATNRNNALKYAFNKTDYIFIFDADDSFHGNFKLPKKLICDRYDFIFGTGFSYVRPLLINNRIQWVWKGVLHEVLCDVNNCKSSSTISGNYYIDSGRSGNRSKNPNKYLDDAIVLSNAYTSEKDIGMKYRYGFYCAQSFKDAGKYDDAITWYKKVLENGNWIQEKYYSCLMLGNLYNKNSDYKNAVIYWEKSYSYDSERIEGIASLMDFFFINGNHLLVNSLYKSIKNYKIIKDSSSKCFLDNTFYYKPEFLNSVSAYYTGDLESGYESTVKLILNKPDASIENYKHYYGNFLPCYMEHLLKDKNNFNAIFEKLDNLLRDNFINDENLINVWNSIFNEINKTHLNTIVPFPKKNIETSNVEIFISFTTCKRLDLFKQTINSLLYNWQDFNKIDYWFCVDDSSSLEDREFMKSKYDWINYYFKDVNEKGHRNSMNIIWNKINQLKPKYWIHIEDDFLFYKKQDYITKAITGLNNMKKLNVKQVLFNRGYAETINDYVIKSIIPYDDDYCIQDYDISKKNSHYINCHYWPNFSFRPSLIDVETILKLGNFDSENQFFEMDYANKWTNHNYKSGFFNDITCKHIGRLTSERHITNIPNAYELNNEEQFTNKNYEIPIKIVNLERRPDRKKSTIDKLSKININKYEWIKAVDGFNIPPTNYIKQLFEGNDFNFRKGVVGCALTHYNLWKQLINDNDNNYYLILEDDCEFSSNFKENIEYFKEDFNKKNLILLGYSMYEKNRNDFDNIYNPKHNNNVNVTNFNSSLFIGGTFSYTINKIGAQILVDYIEKNGIKYGIDYLFKIISNLSIYEIQPQLVFSDWNEGGKEIDSDIQNIYECFNFNKSIDINDFIFIKQKDQIGSDLFYQSAPIDELLKIATYDSNCVGFNTLGFFKSTITNLQQSSYFGENDGIYIKRDIYEKFINENSISYQSQWDQDKILNNELFKNNKNGIYIDIGAHDGISGSNSYFFEKKLQWDGICIEANPNIYKSLVKNRTSKNLNCAIYNKNDKIEFCLNEGYTEMLSGIKETYDNQHVERINSEINLTGGKQNKITVNCFTLNHILEKYNYSIIDYLSIDTEGSEKEIITNIDFNKYHINVINFEVNYENENYKLIQKYLLDNNFKFYKKIQGDDVFINNKLLFSWELKKIKIIGNWCSSKQLIQEWSIMNKYSSFYKSYKLVDDDENIDYYVIINKPPSDAYYIPEKTIIFQMEPWVEDLSKNWGIKTWGQWSNPNPDEFLYIHSRINNLNNVQWQIEIPNKYPTNRENKIVTILSNKNFDIGHIKRIDFVRLMEQNTNNQYIDIFGRENYHNFKNYKGMLKEDKKENEFVNYKYVFSSENNQEHNYATEKIWEPILCECLTFYWGCPNLEEHINSKAFVRLDLDDFVGSMAIIKQAIEEDWWSQRIEYIRKEKEQIINKLGFFPKLENIITCFNS